MVRVRRTGRQSRGLAGAGSAGVGNFQPKVLTFISRSPRERPQGGVVRSRASRTLTSKGRSNLAGCELPPEGPG